ncbi:MAG: DUF3047 domain-containing protein [Candidatus Omnitrophota bacterium]|nr:DUF3047 domain-containing protein [Candidatus Omnitrophota bacterium]
MSTRRPVLKSFFWSFLGVAVVGGAFLLYVDMMHTSTPIPVPERPVEGSIQPPPTADDVVLPLDFESTPFGDVWQERIFEGKTFYEILEDENGERVLHGLSQAASSGLLRKVDLPDGTRATLNWEWKVTQFPVNKESEVLGRKKDDDFAARVYAIFEGRLPFVPEVLQYVWDDRFSEGTKGQSPYGKGVKIIVVQNSGQHAGEWVKESRDVLKDFEMLFGRKPRHGLGAVAIVVDADNTHSEAEAYFRNFTITFPRQPAE